MGLTINRTIYNCGFMPMSFGCMPCATPPLFGYGFGGYTPFGCGFYNPCATSAFAGSILGFGLGVGIASLFKKNKS